MRHVFWVWLALVPYFIGVILYFILRDPLPTPCPKCGAAAPQAFAFCPGCGASIHPICSQCGKTLQQEWANCPHCGNRIAPSGAPASS
jgi:predicted amidophosphoribosyltransferase